MKLKKKLKQGLAFISLVVIATFAFTRKSYAMVPSRPEPEQIVQISPSLREPAESISLRRKDSATVASTSTGTSTETEIVPQQVVYTDPAARIVTGIRQSTGKERVAPESDEQLIGTEVVADNLIAPENTPVVPESDEQLPGIMDVAAGNSIPSQGCFPSFRQNVNNVVRRTLSSASIGPRRPSRTSTGNIPNQMGGRAPSFPGSGGEGSSSNPFGASQSSRESRVSSQGEDQPSCCSIFTCGASKRQPQRGSVFSVTTGKEKAVWWNDNAVPLIHPDHKPQPLGDLNEFSPEKMQMLFGGSEPRYVLNNKCKPKIEKFLKKWRVEHGQPGTSCLGKLKVRNRKASVNLNFGPNYSIDNVIFEDTVPEGYYIESRLFMKTYVRKVDAVDNETNGLKGVFLGDHLWALVNEEDSRRHFSSGGRPDSSTHADLYLPKGNSYKNYACVCCISNHTGVAREPFDSIKLNRTARLSNPRQYNPLDVVSNPLDLVKDE